MVEATRVVLLTNDRHLLDGRPHPRVVVLTPGEFVERMDREWNDHRPG